MAHLDAAADIHQTPAPSSARTRISTSLLLLLLACCIARIWLAPLPSSFWVDEMATEFVVRHPGDPSFQVAPQVPESIYYLFPALMDRVAGFSEVAYRLPSVVFLLLALWLIAHIARSSIDDGAALFAAFTCMALRGFNYQAADARPYALGTLVTAFGFFALQRWLDRGSWKYAAAFAAAGALLWRVQLIFWPMYAGFAAYAAFRLVRRDTAVRWLPAAAVFAVVGVSLLPVAFTALALQRQAAAHVVASKPDIAELTRSVGLALIVCFCAGAALIARRMKWQIPQGRIDWTLLVCWWLAQPLGLFAFSWITGNSVFVARYLFISLPGTALMAVAAARLFLPGRAMPALALATGVAVLLFVGQWGRLWPLHHNSDWRGASTALAQSNADGAGPVICASPFIEARPPVWHAGYPIDTFLYSHLATYEVRGPKYLFPFKAPNDRPSPEGEAYAAELARTALAQAPRFYILGGDYAAGFWREWFAARPEFANWESESLGNFRDVALIEFRRRP